MKTEKAYTEILNQLEIIHAENLAIYEALLLLGDVEEKDIERMSDLWDKRFQNERMKYE